MMDTITALASAPGRGGVAVIRISGPNALAIGQKLSQKTLKARYAHYADFISSDGVILDQGIILYFKGPNSFTGEDVIELHGHGGPLIVDCLIEEILRLGARMAEPGEFSKRAFLNDKMDLIQAEAVIDLINANTKEAAKLAASSLRGAFSEEVNQLIEKMINLRVYVEAAIDFPDEEIDFLSDGHVKEQLLELIRFLTQMLLRAKEGSLLREGVHIVIAGKPNVGKSTLLNCLAREEVAIVTNLAGTTRDIKKEAIDLDGMPVFLIDTAGIRDTDCVVEQEGIKRAINASEKADCVLHIKDINDKAAKLSDLGLQIDEVSTPIINIINKSDLLQTNNLENEGNLYISAKQAIGITELKNRIKQAVTGKQSLGDGLILARRRHILALNLAKETLLNGFEQLETYQAGELLAEDLKKATDCLSEITGGISADAILGKIFSSFCIGK